MSKINKIDSFENLCRIFAAMTGAAPAQSAKVGAHTCHIYSGIGMVACSGQLVWGGLTARINAIHAAW